MTTPQLTPTEIFKHLYNRTLPANFKEWDTTGNADDKFPVELIKRKLNVDIRRRIRWIDYTRNKWSIAHVAASSGIVFPVTFLYWNLYNKDGNTVAHIAAKYGTLPKGFSKLYLINDSGQTVSDVINQGIIYVN